MPEKTIESAYRERLANRQLQKQVLRGTPCSIWRPLQQFSPNRQWSGRGGRWTENPLPAIPRVLDQSKAATIFDRAWHSPWHPYLHSLVAADHVLREAETKPSLRRVFANGRPILSRLDTSQMYSSGDRRIAHRWVRSGLHLAERSIRPFRPG